MKYKVWCSQCTLVVTKEVEIAAGRTEETQVLEAFAEVQEIRLHPHRQVRATPVYADTSNSD